jgi:phospholipase/carboxylesterase
MPMFVSHGTRDPILPFEGGQDIAARAEAAGARVVFVPFDGGHSIPPEVVEQAVSFLRDVFSP